MPLTGRAQAILQPKTKQAEFFASTGRVDGRHDRRYGGRDHARRRPTRPGGGQNLGFIEDGDYVSYKPVNLKDITAMRFRVASRRRGRHDRGPPGSPTGTLVGTTANDHADGRLADRSRTSRST